MGALEGLSEVEVKSSIRNFLQSIVNETNIYLPKIKQIQARLSQNEIMLNKNNLMYSMVADKGYSYYALTLSKNTTERLAQMQELYDIENEIVGKMLGLPSLTYAIYYRDSDGNIVRIKVSHITDAATILSFNPNALSLTGNTIAAAFAKEIEQAKADTEYFKNLNTHYSALTAILQRTYRGKNFSSRVNKNIPEAFERDMVAFPHDDDPSTFSKHTWSVSEAWRYIRASSGNAPWYSGADVLSKMANIQVKGFTKEGRAVNKNGKENPFFRLTGLTSLRSLEDIANLLVNLLNTSAATIEARVEEIYNLLNQDNWENNVELLMEKDIEKLSETALDIQNEYNIPINID